MPKSFEVLACSGHQLGLHDDLRDLPITTLDVELTDPLAEIGRRAQEVFGFDWKWAYYHFVTSPDLEGRRHQVLFSEYVDEDGALSWWFGQLEGIRVADMVRTRDEGLFDGDPYALLIQEPRGGDGVLAGWDDVTQFLVRAGGIYAGLLAVQKASQAVLHVVEACRKQWELRHATPHALFAFILSRESWDYPRLARLLGTSLANSVDLLTALGYEQDRGNATMYRLSTTAPQAEMRDYLEKNLVHGDPREFRRSFYRAQGIDPPTLG